MSIKPISYSPTDSPLNHLFCTSTFIHKIAIISTQLVHIIPLGNCSGDPLQQDMFFKIIRTFQDVALTCGG